MSDPVNRERVLGAVSFVLIVGGVSGLLREWFGWFRLFGFLQYLVPSGYEVYGYGVLVALGVLIGLWGARGRRAR
ncbi:hypothetical protein [Kitasatospora sp. LaBMicrA B282]|uniref:hypothetical protein n=1 Tax=Kitasatospora sp. LaBMicrA B282 TaxID=3420949 RepID=UPI003D12D963